MTDEIIEARLYPLGSNGDMAPNAAWVYEAIDEAVSEVADELRAEFSRKLGELSEWMTWQLRATDQVIDELKVPQASRSQATLDNSD